MQSAAILQHLADELKKFDGKTDVEKNRIREWLFWQWDKLAVPVFRLRARARGQAESDCAAEAQASKADPPGHPHPLFQRAYISFIGIAELPGAGSGAGAVWLPAPARIASWCIA